MFPKISSCPVLLLKCKKSKNTHESDQQDLVDQKIETKIKFFFG